MTALVNPQNVGAWSVKFPNNLDIVKIDRYINSVKIKKGGGLCRPTTTGTSETR